MTDASTIAERQYDGPMPPAVIARLKYGSAVGAEIVTVEDTMHFFRREHGRFQASARKWLVRGKPEMHDRNRADARLYFRGWRALRRELKDLRSTQAGLKGAKRVFDILSPQETSDA